MLKRFYPNATAESNPTENAPAPRPKAPKANPNATAEKGAEARLAKGRRMSVLLVRDFADPTAETTHMPLYMQPQYKEKALG